MKVKYGSFGSFKSLNGSKFLTGLKIIYKLLELVVFTIRFNDF